MHSLISIFIERRDLILSATLQHIYLTFVALLIASLIAIPLGIFLTRKKAIAEPVIQVASIFQTIPSMALLGFMIPFLGIGRTPAITALTIYALLPLLRNTYVGISGVNEVLIDAGKGMGMSPFHILFMIELPTAMPVIMAGLRTATVWTIGVATLASYIGAGGLGDLIFRGIASVNNELILAGAIPASAIAILADFILRRVEYKLNPLNKRGK